MKRDLELVKLLLLEIEEKYQGNPIQSLPENEKNHSKQEIEYHLELMNSYGLINCRITKTFGGSHFIIQGITWSGHDFLDAARNDVVWKAAEDEAEKKGSKFRELPFEIAKALLIQASKNMFGL